MEGGVWDEASVMYRPLGARLNSNLYECTFRTGSRITFAHMQHEKDKYNYQGAQIPYIAFDQLEHFTQSMFFYMLSRNRSLSGVPGYVRGTVNPDPDHWTAGFLSWWIDQETGYPIPERAGVIRYMIRVGDAIVWFDSPQEAEGRYPGTLDDVKSVTFIPSKLSDNKILMDRDPGYRANLRAMSAVDNARLEKGNWKIRREGTHFKRDDFRRWGGGSCVDHTLYVIIDAAYSNKKGSDFTAWFVVGVDAKGDIWVHASGEEKWEPAELIAGCFELMREWKPKGCNTLHIETHKMTFNSLQQQMLIEYFNFSVEPLKHEGVAKKDRILEVKHFLNRIYFRDIHDEWVIDRFVSWIPDDEVEEGDTRSPDDGPDAVGYIVKTVKYIPGQVSVINPRPKDKIGAKIYDAKHGYIKDAEPELI